MKNLCKILIWIVLSVISCNAQAQSIKSDKYYKDGRIVTSSIEKMFKDVNFCLEGIKMNGSEVRYRINLAVHHAPYAIVKDDILLFKFKDGSVHELNAVKSFSADADSDFWDNPDYILYPFYDLDEEDIKTLLNNEVIKVRIQMNTSYIDHEVKGFSKKFKKSYELIDDAMKVDNRPQEKTISDNF